MTRKKPALQTFSSFDELDAAGIGVGYQQRAAAAPASEEAPARSRTWGEAGADVAAQLAEGVNTIGGAIPGLIAPQSAAAEFFRGNAAHWRDAQSEPMRRKIAGAEAQIASADPDSFMDQAVAAAKAYSSDPVLASRLVTTNLPSLIPGVGAAKVAQAARLASGASAAAAAAAGTTAAGATNAVLNAGGARGEAYEDIQDTLVKQGRSREEAEQIALEKSRLPAAVGAATGFLSGKVGLEHALVGRGLSRGGIGAALRAGGGEIAGEQMEEVLPQIATNNAAGEFDNRPLTRNVGRTAVETALASGPTSALTSVMAGLNHEAESTAAAPATPESAAAAPAPTPEQRAQQPDGAPDTMDAATAEIRLAELEVIDSSTGLNPAQQQERAALAQRVEADAARAAELESLGESAEIPSSSGATQSSPAIETVAPSAPAFDPAAAGAKTWPQFVSERGERINDLRRGTPAWDRLQAEWAQVKTARAGTNPEGTGATGAPTLEIQNRDRARPASVVQMQGMAQKPDYMRLGVSRSPESGAPMVFAVGNQVQAAHSLGRADTAVMSDGQRVPFQYAVMEASDVQPSNFADGGVNPMFDSAHPGVVKALNNGRTAGLRAAYERGTAESYKQELMADADMHGIAPQTIAGMKAPVLVRLYSENDNRANMGAKSQSQALGLSATEQAATDAALLDAAALDVFDAGELDSAGNLDFARTVIGRLQAEGQDVAGMLDAGGALSPAGVTRLQAALVHKAYSDGDLVESMFGSTDTDIRAIGESLKAVAGEWASMRRAAEVGAVNPEVDVTGNLLQAIRLVQKARRERASLYDAIQQVDMETGDVVDPITVGMLRMLYSGEYLTRAVGRDRVIDSLREYMAAALATSAGGDMFGEQVGPQAILAALAQPNESTNATATDPDTGRTQQPDAPQGQPGAPGGDPAGRGADEPGPEARRPEPDSTGPGAGADGGRSEGQDAADQGGQPDRQGAEGTAEDGRGAVEPELLDSYTADEVVEREDAEAAAGRQQAREDAAAEQRAQADAERDSFALTGSDSTADEAEARGQAPMFSRSPATRASYEARIDALFSGGKPALAGVPVLERSDVLGLLGYGDKPVLLAEGKVIAGLDNHPRMTAAVWKKVPEWIENPAAVFESDTDGGLVLIAPETLGGAPVSIIIRPEAGAPNTLGAHLLLNAYDRGTSTPFQRWINSGLLRYVDKKEFPALLENTSGRRLLGTAFTNKPGTAKILTEKQLAGYRRANEPMARRSTEQVDEAAVRSEVRRAETQKLVDRLMADWQRRPPVVVASNMQDPAVPQPVREYDARLVDNGGDSEVKGFYYKGQIFLMADALSGPQDIAETLFHETLGHYGLKAAFGDRLDPLLQQIVQARRPEVAAKARDYGLDMTIARDRLTAAEEVLAEMAEKQPQLGFVKRAMAVVRGWLREHVPGFAGWKMTDEELVARFILPAREYVTRAKVTTDRAGEPALPAFRRRGSDPEGSAAPEPDAPQGRIAQLAQRVRDLTSAEAIDTYLYNWQDKFIDLKRIQANIKALNGTVSETNDAYLGEELYHKRVAKRSANFLRDEVQPLLRAMKEAKLPIEEFERFLLARHAAEANRVMAERNPNAEQLEDKRDAADQAVQDLRLKLQRARAAGTSTEAMQKALGMALLERDQWKSAQPFRGTEEERLSLSGMSDAEATKILTSHPAEKRAALDGLAKRVDKINNGTLKTLEDYGLMDGATLAAWRKTYDHYVPLHRDEAHPDSKAHPIGQGFSTKGAASKQRTGSNAKVTNILSHVVMQREAALTRGEKNNVVKKLYLLAAQNPDDALWSLDMPQKKVLDPDTGLVKTVVDQGAKLRDNVVTLRIGAKDKHIVFNERDERAARLALAVKNMDATELDRVTRFMGRITRWFSAVNTQFNPVFGIINVARDLQGSMLQLSTTPLAGKQREVFRNIRKNTLSIYADLRRERREEGAGEGEWAKLWEQMQLDGGTTGYRELYADPKDRADALQAALDQMNQGKAAAAGRAALDWLSDFNETLEATTRLGVYKAALDHGLSRPEAASIAKNITVNFNRKGRMTSPVGNYFAFLNAAIQGNVRMFETLRGPAGVKIMMGGALLGMMSGMAGALMMGGGGDEEDDEWRKIPEFVKERALILPLGRKDYLAIPMPLGFHVFPNIGRKLVDIAMHDDPTKNRAGHLLDLAMIALNSYNPLGGADNLALMVTPTPIDPVVSLWTNKDWTGKPIYKEQRSALDPKPGHAMGKDSVTPPARWLARLANDATGGNEWQPGAWSPNPDAIEYLFGQFTGGVGREATKLGNMATSLVTGEELASHQMTLVGRVYGNTRGVNGQSTAYYENLKRINTSMNEAKGRVERGEDADAVLHDVPLASLDGPASFLEKGISDRVKERRRVQASDDPEKREKVKGLNAEIEQFMHRLNRAVDSRLKEVSAAK